MFASPRLTSLLRAEDARPLYNPDRGWYEMERVRLADDAELPACHPLHALTLLEINLSAYRDAPLSDRALQQLEALLASLRTSGCHTILRPLYDWDGQCFLHEPEDVGLILTHIRQMAPLLHEYAEELFLLQGLLVGNWAEMHGSRHLEQASLRALYEALAEATGPSTYLAVRTPSYWRACVRVRDAVTPDEAAYRLGVFDDALCSSATDLGTFGEEDAAPGSYTHKRAPAEERAFIATLAQHAPFGGETAAAHALNEGDAFLPQMAPLGVSYLNAAYHPDVLAAWKKTPCTQAGAFYGRSCYEAVGEALGYRLLAKEARLKKDSLELHLLNIGSAKLYRDYPATLVYQAERGPAAEIALDTRTRDWPRDIKLKSPLPALPAGSYRVYLRLGGIALANEAAFDPYLRANLLANLHIR